MKITFDETVQNTFNSHGAVMELHLRALACHCECLGMNAENSAAVCAGEIIPYNGERYGKAMEKWGLVDEEGNPTI